MPSSKPATQPTVVIGITAHNDGRFLDDALGSAIDVVRASAVEGIGVSIIVHDDGSTERRTLDVLSRIERCGFEVLRSNHAGLSAGRNRIVNAIAAEFYVPLDADNRLRPDFVVKLLPAVMDPTSSHVLGAYGDAMRFGERTGRWRPGPADFDLLRLRNHIDACALVRVSLLRLLGGYREDLQGQEDWDLWRRAHGAGLELRYVPHIVFDYRCRAGSMVDQIGRRAPSHWPVVGDEPHQVVASQPSRLASRESRPAYDRVS